MRGYGFALRYFSRRFDHRCGNNRACFLFFSGFSLFSMRVDECHAIIRSLIMFSVSVSVYTDRLSNPCCAIFLSEVLGWDCFGGYRF